MPRTAFVYHEGYNLDFGDHVFPAIKYRLIREQLLGESIATPDCFHRPEPIGDAELLLVHTSEWVTKLRKGTLSYTDILKLEIPYSQSIMRSFWLAAGGTLLAARLALSHRIAFNIGGGFHHAFANHGEGFCAINDVAVAVRTMIRAGAIRRALVVDCDVHHGNGTAGIFHGDPDVFTLSIHQWNNYPDVKPPSSLDVHLPDGVEDEEYLSRLRDACEKAMSQCTPGMLFYVAGADPYREDQLGGLNLTFDGMKARDRLVMSMALERGVPVVVTLAGGYASKVEDTVRIHVNTALIAEECLQASEPEL